MSKEEQKACRTILVIDDDSDIRQAIVEVLEMEGHETLEAANGKEALDILATNARPCLVLLDMMMPVMNGREFLNVVQTSARLRPVPIVVVSAHANLNETEGSVGFLRKPVNVDSILKIAAQYCSH